MARSVRLFQFFVCDVDTDNPVKGGSLSKAVNITLSEGELLDQTHKVAPTTAVKLFDKTELETLGAFSFLWIQTDLNVLIQFTASAGVNDVYDVKELAGTGVSGQMGPALVLGSDDTQILDGAIDVFTGTADTIDEIFAYNESASDTARVRIVVGI